MSPPWSIPDYIVIAVVLAGFALSAFLAYGMYFL
jgi:hypothetical protein